VLACAVVGGAAGVGGAVAYSRMNGNNSTTVIYQNSTPASILANSNSGKTMTAEQLYAANVDSCVGITVSTTTTNFWGYTSTSAASGSGFVITQDGYIVTNYHVIEDAAADSSVTITVSFHNGDSYTATLVGGEQDNDVAVLKIDATGLQTVTLGDSSQLAVGQTVMAIGNPLGELTYTLTDGIVSALDRLITTSSTDSNGNTVSTTLNMLQTNCAINPGNSGGPLFNSYGEVIGITTAKYGSSSSGTSVEGLGFAIPINDVKEIISDLMQYGYVTGKPYMGIQMQTVPQNVQQYGVSAGAYILSVASGSCAEKAGLQQGDIIVAVDDTAVDSSSALSAAVSAYRAGDTAKLSVIRQNQQLELTITFDEKNEQTQAANQSSTQQQTQQSQQGQQYQNGYQYSWPFSGFTY
jgi:serine protease Do